MASSSSTEAHSVNIAVGAFDNVATTLPAVAGNPAKQTYNYTGGIKRIYLYGADNAINIYGIKLTYPDEPSALEDVSVSSDSQTHKFLHNGQVFILRDDKIYTLTGQEVK